MYDSRCGAFVPFPLHIDTDRFYATATALANSRVLIAGGYDRHSEATAKAWIFAR